MKWVVRITISDDPSLLFLGMRVLYPCGWIYYSDALAQHLERCCSSCNTSFFTGSAIGDVNDTEKADSCIQIQGDPPYGWGALWSEFCEVSHQASISVRWGCFYHGAYPSDGSHTWMLQYPSLPQVKIWLLRFMTERTSTVAPKLKL